MNRMLSIIIPVFNEEGSIKQLIEKINANITELIRKKVIGDYEIIFISDGSTDRSEQIIKDEIIEDKSKFYSNILCTKSKDAGLLTNIQCYFGRFCENDTRVDFKEFVNYTYTKLLAIKEYLNDEDLEKLEFCKTHKNLK